MNNDDHLKRIDAIIHKQQTKLMRENDPLKPNKRRNKKPEKLVEKEVMQWLKCNQFYCHVVESKAVFSQKKGTYLRGQAAPGFPDIVGCAADGTAVFIELKAKGKRSTISSRQHNFLRRAIEHNAFAVVTDGADDLKFQWDCFCKGDNMFDLLPKKKSDKSDRGDLF